MSSREPAFAVHTANSLQGHLDTTPRCYSSFLGRRSGMHPAELPEGLLPLDVLLLNLLGRVLSADR